MRLHVQNPHLERQLDDLDVALQQQQAVVEVHLHAHNPHFERQFDDLDVAPQWLQVAEGARRHAPFHFVA